jgi:hypothetical protein
MIDKPIPPSVAQHALQTCLSENGEQIGMAATIAQQAGLIERQSAEIERLANDKANVIQQAEIQAQEARTQRAIVMGIGALVGCGNDWEMVGSVSAALKQAGVVPGWEAIHKTLREYSMTTLVDADGAGFPLIDAMSADGEDVSGGIAECEYLADAIYDRLNASRDVAPKDWRLVPGRMHLDANVIESINFHCGDGQEDAGFGSYSDGVLWIGEIEEDDGSKTYGLHIATADYPKEGSTTLVEFAATPTPAPDHSAAITEAQQWCKTNEGTPAEFLSYHLLIKRADLLGRKLTWAETIEITAMTTNMPDTEKAQLLALGDHSEDDLKMGKAHADVLAERRRQVEAEGWTPGHDDEHDAGELASAASAYALFAADELHPQSQGDGDYGRSPPDMWPFHRSWWKPDDERRALIKAGALILAEIERIDRAKLAELRKGES